MNPSHPPLSADTERAVRAFMRKVSDRFPVRGAMLFGSRARGDNRADSDADLAVLLQGHRGGFVDTKLAMADLAYDVLLETGVRIQPLPIWEDEWAHPERHRNARLLANIERDGIRL